MAARAMKERVGRCAHARKKIEDRKSKQTKMQP